MIIRYGSWDQNSVYWNPQTYYFKRITTVSDFLKTTRLEKNSTVIDTVKEEDYKVILTGIGQG